MRKPEIVVSVVQRADRKHLTYRWKDRIAGTKGEETAGTSDRRKADRGVPAFIEELLGRRQTPDIPWTEFREKYEFEHIAGLRESSGAAWRCAANRYEVAVEPAVLADLDAAGISRFRAYFRGLCEETSVDSYLRRLRAAARWAQEIYPGYLAPRFSLGKQHGHGRPLLAEEWERMLDSVQKVVGEQNATSWRFLMRGLVATGLRLGQALALSWEVDAAIRLEGIDLPHPMLVITAEAHKGKRDQTIGLTPPARALFRKVPTENQVGLVFHPMLSRGPCVSLQTASKIICAIGKAAGIKTGTRMCRTKDGIVTGPRFAGAHDLKRTFVQRLLQLGLHPAEVALYAQHASFDTTFMHYTERDAARLADRVEQLYHEKRSARGDKSVTRSDGGIRRRTTQI